MARKSRFSFWVCCFSCLCILTVWLFGREARAENQPRNFSVSLWAGYYLPNNPDFKEFYSDDGKAAGFLEFSKTWLGQIEATMGIGGTGFSSHLLMNDPNAPGGKSRTTDKATLALVPGYLQCSCLFHYAREQKLIPYLGGGLDGWGYLEDKAGHSTKGVKYGYHGLAGVRLLLDWLDPHAAKSSLQEYGVENTYLVLEARWVKIDSFGENKLDLSGPLYKAGLLWEF